MDFSVKDFNVRIRTIRLREALIAIVICFILANYIYGYMGLDNGELFLIIFDVLIMGFFVLVSIGTRGFSKDLNDIFSIDKFLKIIGLSLVDFLFCGVLVGFCASIGLAFTFNMHDSLMASGISDPFTMVLGFISAVFIAPIAEELLFRAVIFNRLKIKRGAFFAIVVSSLIFGLGHHYGATPLLHVVTASVFGMLMCVFYMKYDNILMNISVHFLGNLLVYLQFTPLFAIFSIPPFSQLMDLACIFSVFFVPIYIIYYGKKFG